MKNAKRVQLVSGKMSTEINVRTIQYIKMEGNIAHIHRLNAPTLSVRMTLSELQELLGANFLKIKRNCLVSVYAIHSITDKVNLISGEELDYARQSRKVIEEDFYRLQRELIHKFTEHDPLKTEAEYRAHYRVFDTMPFAFTDIEMVFDETNRAVDWVFCYGNEALAELERVALPELIGKRFSEVFPNMDEKWLRAYERSVLFEEMLNIVDYSPEIDANLEIICFPTFRGHCGCILLDVEQLHFFRRTNEREKAVAAFVGKLLG